MSHHGGSVASGVLGFTVPLPVLPDWSEEMGPVCPFWTCHLLPDGCNPRRKGAVPGCICAGYLLSRSVGSFSTAFLFPSGEGEHIHSAEGRRDHHKNKTSLTVRDWRLTNSFTKRGLCRAAWLTDHSVTSAASGDWVYSPCQPADMESVIRKWADGDILQISPHYRLQRFG